MAKRKKAQPWDAVFDRMQVLRLGHRDTLPGAWVCAPPATDAELDAAQADLGSPLPPSYRQFMKRFGPGELLGWVRIHPLTSARRTDSAVVSDTRGAREYVKKHRDRFPNTTWFAQLVYFGSNGGGDIYCWDPSAGSRAHPQEYPCYCLPHEEEENATPIGETFWEFIAWGAPDYRSVQEHEPDEIPPAITFWPQKVREKKVPAKTHAKRWLAANNNTARDLALSIRERGQTDAFPILADALEEAGCTNADLLDSCRHGDPDIDGVWVLRVLLGEPPK